MNQQDFVPPDNVLALLREHPEGLTVREVADELNTSFVAAQNALRDLHLDDMAEVRQPTTLYETKRWVHDA